MNEKPVSVWNRGFFPRISLFKFIRWLFSWRGVRCILFCLACLTTLVAILYAEENWRGKREWEKYKSEWEAKGEKFDWQAFIPPAVPDDQNFFMAPFWEDVRVWIEQDKMNDADRLAARSNTNEAGRLVHLKPRWYRAGILGYPRPKPPEFVSWQNGRKTDMKAWQEYYRAPLVKQNDGRDSISSRPTKTQTYVDLENMEGIELLTTPDSQSPAADVLQALGKYGDTVELLRQAASRPQSRSWARYFATGDIYLTQYEVKIWTTSSFLQLLTAAELAAGQNQNAAGHLNLLLYLADILNHEPDQQAFLIRAGILRKALSVIWEGMGDRRWSEGQLKALQDRLESEDLLPGFERVMQGERALILYELDEMAAQRNRSRFYAYYSQYWNAPATNLFSADLYAGYVRLAPRGWFDADKVAVSEWIRTETTLLQPPTGAASSKSSETAGDFSSPEPGILGNYLFRFAFGSDADRMPAQSAQRAVFTQTSLKLAVLACALERYRNSNGNYPEKLDELAPRFISKVPHEVTSGQSFSYRRSEDGWFVLSSAGLTGQGGKASVRLAEGVPAGNWVWRYPAKD